MTFSEYLKAEREGFSVAADLDPVGDEPGTFYLRTPYGPFRVNGDERDAQRLAVSTWKRAHRSKAELAELGRDANTSNEGRARLRECLENEAAALRKRIGNNGFEITVADGSLWLGNYRMTAPAIEAEAEQVVQVRENEALKRAAFGQATETAGYIVRLATDDDLGRENRHLDWESKYVDVIVPLAHPQIPTTGRAEIVDGKHLLETDTRLALAQRWGFVWPEAPNERVARREALDAAQRRAQHRADQLDTEAREAAHAANGDVSA